MPIRIAIDVRRTRDFGIGTYIRNLVHALAALDRENHYVLVALNADEPELADLPPNFEIAVYRRQDTDWMDQFAFYFFLRTIRADLVHMPLNLVPVRCSEPSPFNLMALIAGFPAAMGEPVGV